MTGASQEKLSRLSHLAALTLLKIPKREFGPFLRSVPSSLSSLHVDDRYPRFLKPFSSLVHLETTFSREDAENLPLGLRSLRLIYFEESPQLYERLALLGELSHLKFVSHALLSERLLNSLPLSVRSLEVRGFNKMNLVQRAVSRLTNLASLEMTLFDETTQQDIESIPLKVTILELLHIPLFKTSLEVMAKKIPQLTHLRKLNLCALYSRVSEEMLRAIPQSVTRLILHPMLTHAPQVKILKEQRPSLEVIFGY